MHKSVKTCFLYFVFAATAQWVLRSLSFWSWSSVKSRPQAKNVPRSPPRFKSTPIQFHYEGRTDGCKLWEEWWWKIFSSHLSPWRNERFLRENEKKLLHGFQPFLGCKLWNMNPSLCDVMSHRIIACDLICSSAHSKVWQAGDEEGVQDISTDGGICL